MKIDLKNDDEESHFKEINLSQLTPEERQFKQTNFHRRNGEYYKMALHKSSKPRWIYSGGPMKQIISVLLQLFQHTEKEGKFLTSL